jgi:MFS family permease
MQIYNKGAEMRQSNTQFMKRILKIAIFILGVLLIITGIISGAYAFILLQEGKSEGMPFVVMSLLALIIGICICVLVKEVPRYLAKTRKMSREEKVIENIKIYMKKGKSRIATLSIFLVVMITTSIWFMSMWNKLTETMTPAQFRLLAAAKLMVYNFYFGLFTGFIVYMLINEFAGFTKNKHRLTLNMWERIRELEREVKDLKTGTQPDAEHVAEPESGESPASG